MFSRPDGHPNSYYPSEQTTSGSVTFVPKQYPLETNNGNNTFVPTQYPSQTTGGNNNFVYSQVMSQPSGGNPAYPKSEYAASSHASAQNTNITTPFMPAQALIYGLQPTPYSPQQQEIYKPPVVHNGSIVYPSHFTNVEELRQSVASHYRAYAKLVLCGLTDEQYDYAFAAIIPQWSLNSISFQRLSLETVRKIITVMNFSNLFSIKLAELNDACLSEVYEKFRSYMSQTPQIIKFFCEPNTITQRWQEQFKYLSGSKSYAFIDAEFQALSAELAAKDFDLQSLQNRYDALEMLMTTQRNTFDHATTRQEQKYDALQKSSEQELKESAQEVKSLEQKFKSASEDLKSIKFEMKQVKSIHGLTEEEFQEEQKKNRLLVAEFKELQSILAAKAVEFQRQADELSVKHSCALLEIGELKHQLIQARGTIQCQRDARRKDKEHLEKFSEESAIIAEAVHLARIRQIIDGTKKRFRADTDSSSSDSESDNETNSHSDSSCSSSSTSSSDSSVSSTEPASPRFFITIRKEPQLKVVHSGVGRKPR